VDFFEPFGQCRRRRAELRRVDSALCAIVDSDAYSLTHDVHSDHAVVWGGTDVIDLVLFLAIVHQLRLVAR
jgi:hypothetical protein